MKWPRWGMETAWQAQSRADPQARGPPISSSEDRGSLSLSPLTLSVTFSSLSQYGFTWPSRRGGKVSGDEGRE